MNSTALTGQDRRFVMKLLADTCYDHKDFLHEPKWHKHVDYAYDLWVHLATPGEFEKMPVFLREIAEKVRGSE